MADLAVEFAVYILRRQYVRRAAKRDTAEKEIVDGLRAVGALVVRLNWPIDLLVRHKKRVWLMEIKSGPHLRKDQQAQREFCRAWEVPIVKTPDDALAVIGVIKCKT